MTLESDFHAHESKSYLQLNRLACWRHQQLPELVPSTFLVQAHTECVQTQPGRTGAHASIAWKQILIILCFSLLNPNNNNDNLLQTRGPYCRHSKQHMSTKNG